MNISTRTRQWLSLGFAGTLYLLAGVQMLHRVSDHADHSDLPTCHVNQSAGQHHIHHEGYGQDLCNLCLYCVSADQAPDPILAPLPLGGIADARFFPPDPPVCNIARDTTCLRGPPVL